MLVEVYQNRKEISRQGSSTISKFDMGISDAPSLVSAEEGFSQTSHPTHSAQETVIPEIWLHILRTSIFGIINNIPCN